VKAEVRFVVKSTENVEAIGLRLNVSQSTRWQGWHQHAVNAGIDTSIQITAHRILHELDPQAGTRAGDHERSTKVGQLLHGALEEQQEQEGRCRPARTEP
jgi:hypothetical protein